MFSSLAHFKASVYRCFLIFNPAIFCVYDDAISWLKNKISLLLLCRIKLVYAYKTAAKVRLLKSVHERSHHFFYLLNLVSFKIPPGNFFKIRLKIRPLTLVVVENFHLPKNFKNSPTWRKSSTSGNSEANKTRSSQDRAASQLLLPVVFLKVHVR